MQKAIVVVLVLAGCGSTSSNNGNGDGGSGTDYAPPYVGAWTSTVTVTANGSSQTETIDIPIEENSTNVIELQGFCSASDAYGSGPTADTSSSGFTVLASSCSFSDPSDCASGDIVLAVTDGSGTLNNGTLNGSIDGSLTCGSTSVSFTLAFNSSSKGNYGTQRGGVRPTKALATAFRQRE
jgi:hypothetical protein